MEKSFQTNSFGQRYGHLLLKQWNDDKKVTHSLKLLIDKNVYRSWSEA